MKPATQEQVDAAFELLSPKDFAQFCAEQDQLQLTQVIKAAELLSPVWGQGPAADLFDVQASSYPVWKQECLGEWGSADPTPMTVKVTKQPKTYFSGRFA